MKLGKDIILKEAFNLLNEVGLDKFNMRSLASNLSVSATALYWHYKNKNDLIADMVNQIYTNAYSASMHCKSWQSNLMTLGNSLKHELAIHRDSIRLIATRVPTENESLKNSRESIAERMVLDGLDEEHAWQFVSIVISFVLGWMSYYQNEQYRTFLNDRFDFDGGFDIAITSLVTGFEGFDYDNSGAPEFKKAFSP